MLGVAGQSYRVRREKRCRGKESSTQCKHRPRERVAFLSGEHRKELPAQAGPSAYRLKVQGRDKIVERLVDPVRRMLMPKEILFLVEESPEGGYEAQVPGFSIYTQAETLEELKEMAVDAVRCHFDEGEMPRLIRLHLVKEEVIAI